MLSLSKTGELNLAGSQFLDEFSRSRSLLRKTIVQGGNAKPSERAVQEYEKIKQAFVHQSLRIVLQVCTPFSMVVNLIKSKSTHQRYQNAPRVNKEHMLYLLDISVASVNSWGRECDTSPITR